MRRHAKPCDYPGCPHTTHGRFCEEHSGRQRKACGTRGCPGVAEVGAFCPACIQAKARAYDGQRGNANTRGYTKIWRTYARNYLALHRRCVKCGKRSQHVDHSIPVKGPADPLFWKRENHQALCMSCHSSKTQRERKETG